MTTTEPPERLAPERLAPERLAPERLDSERLTRLADAVALASIGEYVAALDGLEPQPDDELGRLEESLRIFIHELKTGNEAREHAMAELESARADLEQKLAFIEGQRQVIHALSAPILEVWRDVLTVPLVGALDRERANDVTEKLLRRLVETRARACVIDLTGIDDVDQATADHLIRLTRAVKLLGARCVITGVSPKTARLFAETGQGLGDVRCSPNLREGLQRCLHERPEPVRPDARRTHR